MKVVSVFVRFRAPLQWYDRWLYLSVSEEAQKLQDYSI
jgi:hypothetical protein